MRRKPRKLQPAAFQLQNDITMYLSWKFMKRYNAFRIWSQ